MNDTAMPLPAVWFPAIRAGTGVDVFTIRLAEELRKRGLAARITWLPHRAEYIPWTVTRPRAPSWANIVHVNTWTHPRFLPPRLPIVATTHLCVHDPKLSPYKSLAQHCYHRYWIKPLEQRVMTRADQTIAVSNYTAERARNEFRVRGLKVIHNGVPDPSSTMSPMASEPNKPFRLLYVGNWSSRKGVDLLPEIMTSLGPDFELWYTADINGAHAKYGLPKNTKCIGRLSYPQLESIYRRVDALVFPTRLEGFGLVAAEAMIHGVPVVAGASDVLSEVVTHGVDGFLCAQDDVDGYVETIRNLASNNTVRSRMSEEAISSARAKFSLKGMVDRYIEVYCSVLSSQGQGS